MEKKKKSFKKHAVKYGLTVLMFVIGAVGGAFVGRMVGRSAMFDGLSFGEFLLVWGAVILGMCLAVYLQIIVHEAGHLVFGILSGYRFSSFRIGSIMLVRINGKIQTRRLSLAGTGGQCLMQPPELADGKMPYVLYNLGGAIMNLIAAAVSAVLYVLLRDFPYAAAFFLFSALFGAIFALTNGIPMHVGIVDNDGCNARSMGKNPDALESFYLQLKINALQVEGVRLKDMPDSWFREPEDGALKNAMTAARAVFCENRMMDSHDFPAAKAYIDRVLAADTALAGLYRGLLVCDRIYCGLVTGEAPEKMRALLTKEQLRFMKQMKGYISVIRTEYALALFTHDEKKTQKLHAQFDRVCKTHPAAADVASERELVEIARGMM